MRRADGPQQKNPQKNKRKKKGGLATNNQHPEEELTGVGRKVTRKGGGIGIR